MIFGPSELHSCFSADRQRLSQHFGSFRASAGVKQNPSLQFEYSRLEPPRAKLSGKPHHSIQVALHQIEVAVLIAGERTQGQRQSVRRGAVLQVRRREQQRRRLLLLAAPH